MYLLNTLHYFIYTADADISTASTPVNGLTRSRRSHFSRKDSTPEMCSSSGAIGNATITTSNNNKDQFNKDQSVVRIVHEYERLMYYAKSPHSWALPNNWANICEKFPSLIRNKVSLFILFFS